ncbi:MAG: hypothetical protein SFW67_23395 [Myxococcaceae bacterium]|nr:hypothetical protein [Myxococcaceae bacterium]
MMEAATQEPARKVDAALTEGISTTRVGVLVLVEVADAEPQVMEGLVEALEGVLPARASLHAVADSLFAVVAPGHSLFDGWSLVELTRELFAHEGVGVSLGLAAWPMEGPTVTDVFGAAVASLVEDRSRPPAPEAEARVEFDGLELSFLGAGEFLSA